MVFRLGLLEQEFFNDDTLNIDIKPPMHYLNQTSLSNVACPSTTAFDSIANEAATTLQATYRGKLLYLHLHSLITVCKNYHRILFFCSGMQGRDEMQERRRDSTRDTGNELDFRRRSLNQGGDICGQITPSVLEGCGYDPNIKKVGSKHNQNNQHKQR